MLFIPYLSLSVASGSSMSSVYLSLPANLLQYRPAGAQQSSSDSACLEIVSGLTG